MGKFKVGDIVTIKSKEWFDNNRKNIFGDPKSPIYDAVNCGDLNFTRIQTKYCGKSAKIESVSNCGFYRLDIDDTYWIWCDLMLEG